MRQKREDAKIEKKRLAKYIPQVVVYQAGTREGNGSIKTKLLNRAGKSKKGMGNESEKVRTQNKAFENSGIALSLKEAYGKRNIYNKQ